MLDEYKALLMGSITDPRAAARRLFALQISRQSLWALLMAVACLAVIMIFITLNLNPPAEDEVSVLDVYRPIPLAMIFMATWAIMALCTYYIGKGFRGVGDFDNSLKTVLWLEIVQTTYLAIQIILFAALPLLGVFISLAAIFLILRCYVMFVVELHGFSSPPLVFIGIMVSLLAILFAVTILFGILIAVLGLEVQNV